jgi:hypothetical protein
MDTELRTVFGRTLVCLALGVLIGVTTAERTHADETADPVVKIKAFCIDFNWGPGGPNGFAAPGLWADADPAEHVRWYKDLGANTIQTFCVSCNGYAWYKGGVVPEQPGLESDFLREVIKLGHEEGMKVMGYFCVGANTLWGKSHPDLSYGIPSNPHIPFTTEYLDYLCGSIRDALTETDIDGFMIDWMWNTGGKWLECERKMYSELFSEPFPGKESVDEDKMIEFHRRAIDRCWSRIRAAAKSVKPDCIIWLSCHELNNPQVVGSKMFREVDWLMNEHPDPSLLEAARNAVGPHTQIVQCLCGWGSQHDAAKVINDPRYKDVGFYGFAKPDETSLPPITRSKDGELTGNARNIETMRKAFRTE